MAFPHFFMHSTRNYTLLPQGDLLVLALSSAEIGFIPETIWNPSPSVDHRTDPYPVPQALRIGMCGNALTSAKFSPPPMAVVLEGGGRRWFLGIGADAGWHRWNEATFEAGAEGIRIVLDLEGMTDPASAKDHIRVCLQEFDSDMPLLDVLAKGLASQYPIEGDDLRVPDWWLRPIYCGWGDQVAHAMHEEGVGLERRANAYCIQGLYERWIRHLDEESVPVGTVTIDGGWSLSGVWEPDPIRWPDLRGFIQRQHQAGRKVLLWIGTWLWDGLPKELSILGDGRQWTADPGNPAYRDQITRWVTELISPDGFDADGFKIDQLGFTPNKRRPRWCPRFGFLEMDGDPVTTVSQKGEAWGMELLYQYQKTIYQAAKAAKPEALITSSTVHPYFRDTFDMVRLHDMGHVPTDLMAAMGARAGLARAALPGFPIDTDDWVHIDYDLWLDYTSRSFEIGVPCLFYTEHFIAQWNKEPGTVPIRHLGAIAEAWRKAGYRKPEGVSSTEQTGGGKMSGYQSE